MLAVKGPRFVTHIKRLRDVETPLANFFASGLLELGDKLGPLLWQLPPTLAFDADLLDGFLGRLPRSRADASALAAGHDERMSGRASFAVARDAPLRHAVEVRHPSFDTEEWIALLEHHGVASVTADTAGRYPRIDRSTADFAYARLHGDEELYVSGYDDDALDRWAKWTRAHLDAGRDAFLYFDNDVKVRAPFDAMGLIARLPRPERSRSDPADQWCRIHRVRSAIVIRRAAVSSSPRARPVYNWSNISKLVITHRMSAASSTVTSGRRNPSAASRSASRRCPSARPRSTTSKVPRTAPEARATPSSRSSG